MSLKILTVAVGLLFLISHIFAQNLEAILSDTKLPIPVVGMPVVYDEADLIYLFGGNGASGLEKDILKFNVTTQTLEKFGTMDPVGHGSAVWTNEKILYFGGYLGFQDVAKVWSYRPDGAGDWTQVGSLPRTVYYTSSVWDEGEYSYIFGGLGNRTTLNTITRYSSVTNLSINVGELPGGRDRTSAIWDEITGNAYIFGGNGSSVIFNDIVKFNPATGTVVKLNVTLPEAIYDSCAIWTGTDAYIIGGRTNCGQLFDITRFNPSTNQVLKVQVNNLPPNLERLSCAFVKKLNRIYMFGGYRIDSRRDEIMYIDLGPPPITTTQEPGNPMDCQNEVCGTRFPHPIFCDTFYQCENQEPVLRQCPTQLHFNPSHRECDFPEVVKCRPAD